MKNKFKIITVILSCLLLIGAAVGFYASAADADAPEITIYKRSVSYEGAPRIVYLIETANAENYTAKIVFSKDNAHKPSVDDVINDAGAAGAYSVGKIDGKQAYGGKEYDYICSDGIAPAFATRPEYAYPVLVDADNKIVAVGALDEYSLFDYYTARLSSDGVGDVSANLYKAALAYSASVQDVLIEENPAAYSEADLEKYGWADAYYVVNVTTNLNGTEQKTEQIRYRESDVVLEAPKSYNGTIFAGFEKDGEKVGAYGDNTASSWNYYDTTLKIGQNNFTYNYAGGKVQTWTDADGADLTLKGSGLFYPDANSALTVDTTSETLVWADVIDGALAFGSTNTAQWRPFEIMNKNATAGAVGKTYVFETDMNINWENDATSASDQWLVQFAFTSNAWYGDGDDFALFAINRTSATEYKIQCLDKTGGDWANLVTGLKFDETYNLRIEYEITSLGTTSTTPADSKGIGNVNVYINGELQATFTATGYRNNMNNKNFTGIGFLDRGYKGTGTHTVYFDNTYIATED